MKRKRERTLPRGRPEKWTVERLIPYEGCVLYAVCRLLGLPYSGTKRARAERIVDTLALRREVAAWGELNGGTSIERHDRPWAIAEEICPQYTKPALLELARRAKTYRGLPKRALIIGLLQWRENCQRLGRGFLKISPEDKGKINPRTLAKCAALVEE